jgi:hypothetical protein
MEEKERNLRANGLEIIPVTEDTVWKNDGKTKGKLSP